MASPNTKPGTKLDFQSRSSFSLPEIGLKNGISLPTVYAEVQAGRLTARKIGRRRIVTAKDEAAWLDSLPVVNTEAAS